MVISERKIGVIMSYINIVVKNIVTFVYTPLLLKFVGQSQYGLFQMTNSVILSLGILSMGLSSAYVKFYIGYETKGQKSKIRQLNSLYLCMFIFVSLLSVIITALLTLNVQYLFGASLSSEEILLTRKLMILLGINLALTFPSSVFDSNILVNEKFKFQQIRQLLQTVLVPMFSIPMVMLGFNVLIIAINQTVVTLIFLFLNFRYCYKKLNMRFDFKNMSLTMLKPLFMFSFFILLNQVVDMINNNAPTFILGIVSGANEAATFAIAIQIKNMFFMLSTSFSSVFVPKVNNLVSSNVDKNALTELMIKVGRIQMLILGFVLGGFIVVGQFFINKWAGSQNSLAYLLIIIMVLPSLIPLSQNIGIEIQRAYNKHIFRSICYSIFAVLNLIITYFGAKYFGLLGGTFGYVVSIVVANGLLMNMYYHKKIKLNMKKYWIEIFKVIIPFIFTTSLFVFITRYVPINSYLKFITIGVLYVILYLSIYFIFIANDYEKSNIPMSKKKRKDVEEL